MISVLTSCPVITAASTSAVTVTMRRPSIRLIVDEAMPKDTSATSDSGASPPVGVRIR